ncbi:MAG: TetR/AcrR family transcriptional regulator [Eubacterium sp.]|nr:TetR/AcrR family transcriptional regulator [Eubacterium sp.]
MTDDFISARDRIVSASIDIISDAGLASLTIKNISMRTNIREDMLYKYYSNTDEILIDIVQGFFRFDNAMMKTASSKNVSYVQKILLFNDALISYYDSYYSVSAIMLQYEELLHNTHTREIVEIGYNNRRKYIADLFEEAIKANEIKKGYKAENLADVLLGIIHICTFNRRVMNRKRSLKEEITYSVNSMMKTIVNNPEVLE